MKNKKPLIICIVAILTLVCITVGVSLAFFNYAQAGTTDNIVETGSITFLYTETSSVGRGIAITDAFPISNSEGKLLTGEGNVFDFNISSETTSNTNIPYEITARKKADSTLGEDVVVMYLTKVNGTSEEEVLLDKYSNLTQTEKTNAYTEKVLYSGTVYSESDYDQDYRLRMWISDDGAFESDDMGKTFTVTVNVYSNATVITESDKALENNNNVTSVSVNNNDLTKIENKSYDYEVTLDEGTTSATLNIETEVPNAKVKVEKLNNLAKANSLTRLSTQITLTDLVDGSNLFKITVLSENEKVSDEYVLKVQVGIEKFSQTILNNNKLSSKTATLNKKSNDVNENGLYVSTDTNSGEPTYYFRGNVNNNYVSFAGMTWRIVRINEDGTVRLILQNGINNDKYYNFNTSCKGMDYMYYSNSDIIKPTLDSWYQTNLAGYSNKIATGEYFCEQVKVNSGSSYKIANTLYYKEYTSNFRCVNDVNGKGLINSNIGTITYDEIIHSGAYDDTTNRDYYLYNGKNYWTMSPCGLYKFSQESYLWKIGSYGNISWGTSTDSLSIRPVINLKSNVVVTGTGTSTDPYVVQ